MTTASGIDPLMVPALSIRPPWGQLILGRWKPCENRTWATKYRGLILIHAGQTWDPAGAELAAALRVPQWAIPARTAPSGYLGVYSLRKWMRLAVQGNPTVLVLLYATPIDGACTDPLMREIGQHLLERPDMVVSRFIGYLRSQRAQLLGLRGKKHTNRPELVDKYGFDTKFAGHMVRLGVQGVELLETGRITLPMPEPTRSWIRALRVGEVPKEKALDSAEELEGRLNDLLTTSLLPERPDMRRVNQFLTDAYLAAWERWRTPR